MLRVNNLVGFGASPAASASQAYRYLRIHMTGIGTPTDLHEISELEWMVGATAYPTSNMTSNVLPSPLVASANSQLGGTYAPWKAFNGTVAERGWISAASGTNWLKIDLGSGNAIAPTGIKIAAYALSGTLRYPTDFTCEGSNDDSSWTTLYTGSGVTTGWSHQTLREFTF